MIDTAIGLHELSSDSLGLQFRQRITPMLAIVEYRPEGPLDFERYAELIKAALGPMALRIDHIGSTSVPGMAAKDVIDIQVTVAELLPEVAGAMSQAGFEMHSRFATDHVPPGLDPEPDQWSKMLFKQPPGQRRAHIHIRREGNANQRYPLLFRDYLIASPSTAAAYSELKRRLAAGLADPSTYPEVKDPAVDLIYLAAREWADRMGRNPDRTKSSGRTGDNQNSIETDLS
jgi:GrpB-like predicted nucleotidyltransferase (UPF0157 family)